MKMATKEECDTYAAELAQKFEELTRWAIQHWPKPEFPLLPSDFSNSCKEIGEILGPKLGEGDDSKPASSGTDESKQYVDMNPMPWP
jgi:hypothetical protein